ncbi:hypothetical protein ESCO_005149 [Escovopsis weberi]|uniref:Uncharacterized protein n=1 Tax=Escovopsis weberi TaxID=150374 RepID=A0A0M9VW05_ESCWE|nr:hypothetical protein ESCO_005149 [Escovopsis weberi]
MPQLPAIPEGFRSRADQKKFLKPEPWLKPPSTSHHRSRSLSQLGVETEECVYFRSTPFTLTNPAFRHGPITFQKSEIKGGSLLTESPVFDLAAFQSAIGGVGDLSEVLAPEEARDNSDEDDESHMADEVTAWFKEFGFETHGELIVAEKPSDRNLDRTSWDSACSMGTTLSMPLIIKTDLADSAAEPQKSLTTSSVHDLTVDYSTY